MLVAAPLTRAENINYIQIQEQRVMVQYQIILRHSSVRTFDKGIICANSETSCS